MKDIGRRKLILGLAALPLSGITRAATTTPAASEGPFYPSVGMRYRDNDNDLVKIEGEVKQAGGEIVRLAGRVVDRDGRPVRAARVEIWQCDAGGRYLHRGDSGSQQRDRAFQGFGQSVTGEDGGYTFRTIKPVPYTGRTPHIHVKVFVGGREHLTTQFYLADHPDNERDWLYQRIAPELRESVSMVFRGSDDEPEARVDLVI